MRKIIARIKKKVTSKRKYEEFIPHEEYFYFMKQVSQWLLETPKKEERLILLDFVIDMVKRDLQMDLLTEVFYKEEARITNLLRKELIPMIYIDAQNDLHSLESIGEEREINLTNVVTIVIPWKINRMKSAILGVKKEGFSYRPSNHKPSYFFEEIELCYVASGNHSIASGILQKKGKINVDVYSIQPLFENVKVDIEDGNLYWFNLHTDRPLKNVWGGKKEVFDFRVGVLYELARMKNLECNFKNN